MSFFFFKNKPSLSFVFDIRDTSISVAATKFQADKKPEIILCQNFEIRHHSLKNDKEYLASMLATLDTAILSIRRSLIKIGNKEKIGTHYFFIGSPWSVSQTKTIKIIKDKIFEINNSILEKIIFGEEFLIEKNIQDETSVSNWKIFEEKIVQSKLNGYKVDNIFGKKTTNLAIELFVSFIPYEIKDKLFTFQDNKIGKKIKKQNNSCILSSYSFFRDLYSNKNDFIYVDLGKLITDIYVVRDDIIFGIVSIPFGEENIIQTSLSKTNLSRDIFMSHINIGHDNKFELKSHNNGADLLKTGFDLWQNKLKDSLSKICTEMNIPNNLFIISNSVVSDMLTKEIWSKENNRQLELLGSRIETSVIKETVLNNYLLNPQGFLNEPYVKMDIVFLDKMLRQ